MWKIYLIHKINYEGKDADVGSIPGLGRSPGGGYGNALRIEGCSNILAWRIPQTEQPDGLHTVHGVAKSDMTEHP